MNIMYYKPNAKALLKLYTSECRLKEIYVIQVSLDVCYGDFIKNLL